SVWGDLSDITDAVFEAGYRKPKMNIEEAVLLTIDVMNGVPDEVPYPERPRDLNDILSTELSNIIFDATWDDAVTPASVAKVVLDAGYRKE
uniref:hypothetical protein n=1 Tax=Photorhabdus sp. RM322S TaxID=3342825 RepID=UPI0036DB6362